MSILITSILSVCLILSGKYFFGKWFNHLSIYSFSWSLFIILYEIKLMRYVELTTEAWIVIIITTIGILSGTLSFFCAKDAIPNSPIQKITQPKEIAKYRLKPIKYLILFTSIVGFYTAIQHWMVLIDKFGSIAIVFARANLIYRMRVAGDIEGVIPYLFVLPYAGIVLGGIYTAIKNKISLLALLPFIAVILKDAASIGRGGIFVGFLMFVTSFFLYRHLLAKNLPNKLITSNKKIIFSSILLLILVIFSLTAVKNLRGSFEDFKGKSQTFKKFDKIPVVTPSLYIYFSSNVGVFSEYFKLQEEEHYIGENSFLPLYNFLSKFGVVKQPDFYPRGYTIPIWTNSATYLRDLHTDFGYFGLFFIPFFLSLIATFYWFKFYEKGDVKSFIILTYINIILSFSVFFMITRAAFFLLSFLFLIIIIPVFEKITKRKFL